jgi:hypothetical protein
MDLVEGLKAAFQNLPLAVQIIGLMILFSAGDFVSALIAAARSDPPDFHGTQLGKWVTSKGLPIITVALLYGLDQATHFFTVDIGGFDLGAFGAIAYAQGISFIAQEGFSIVKNLKSPTTDDAVPPPDAVLTERDAAADLAGTPRPDNPSA